MKHYTINEKAAKEAKSLWSFSDYEEESKTREYQSQVDEVDTIVSELPEELQEKGEALADAYAKKLADWYNKQDLNLQTTTQKSETQKNVLHP